VVEGKTARRVSLKGLAEAYLWVCVVGVGLILVLVMGLTVADVIRWHNRDDLQGLDIFPKPLTDTSLAPAQGITRVTQSGCSIDLPWSNVTVLRYGASLPDGRGVVFSDPASEADEAAIFRGEQGTPSTVPVFGATALQSNYALLAAQLNFNPAELSYLPWGRDHARQVFLAVSKSMLTQKYPLVYSVAMGNVRGFQFGDPSHADRFVELRMFDPKDRQFRVRVDAGKTPVPWTQPEINFMVNSMRCDDAAYSAARQAWEAKIHQRQ
jgi:hypothetical protein